MDFQIASPGLTQPGDVCVSLATLPTVLNSTWVALYYKTVVISLMLISSLSIPGGYLAVFKCDMQERKQTKLYEIMVVLAINR